MHYDYLIVGTGLFGACFAHEMRKAGKSCLLIDKIDHIAGTGMVPIFFTPRTDRSGTM